jgi:hypothetical protein
MLLSKMFNDWVTHFFISFVEVQVNKEQTYSNVIKLS